MNKLMNENTIREEAEEGGARMPYLKEPSKLKPPNLEFAKREVSKKDVFKEEVSKKKLAPKLKFGDKMSKREVPEKPKNQFRNKLVTFGLQSLDKSQEEMLEEEHKESRRDNSSRRGRALGVGRPRNGSNLEKTKERELNVKTNN